jgi:hypothetical protein
MRRYVPTPDSCTAANDVTGCDDSFDHLIGGHEQAGRHGQAERLRRFEVDDRFELGRRLHGKVGGLVAAQDAVDIGRRLPIQVDEVNPVGHETTCYDERTQPSDCWQTVLGRERDDEIAVDVGIGIGRQEQAAVRVRAKASMMRSMSATFSTKLGTSLIPSDGDRDSAARR